MIGVSLVLLCLIGGAVEYLLGMRYYQAVARFLPADALSDEMQVGGAGALGSFASQFGVDLSGGGIEPSYFFAEILARHQTATRLLSSRFPTDRGDSTSLIEILDAGDLGSLVAVDRARRALSRRVLDLAYDKKSGVSTLRVVLPDRSASLALSQMVVVQIDSVYSTAKRAVAVDRLRFVSERLAEAENDLGAAEVALRDFRVANRQNSNSPQLQLEESRLQRDIALKQEVFRTLKSQEVLGEISASRDVSEILVIDPPYLVYRQYSPRLSKVILKWLAILVSGLCALWAVGTLPRLRTVTRSQ